MLPEPERPTGGIVLLFQSIHHVMKMERRLLRVGIRCDLRPVPRELSADCGMAVEISRVNLSEALSIAESHSIRVEAVYQTGDDGYHEVWDRRSSQAGRVGKPLSSD